MGFRAHRDVTRETGRVSIYSAQRRARPRNRFRLGAQPVWNLAVVDMFGAILRVLLFMARVPVRAHSHAIPAAPRQSA